MKFIKIKELSVPGAIIISGIIIGGSVFLTTWFFFGGANNRTKVFLGGPSKITAPQNTLTPAQIQQLQQAQQQRLQQQQSASTTPSTNTKAVPTTVKPKAN